MKKCPKCLDDKPVSEFHKNAAKKDGLSVYCRPCNNRAEKERYKKNPEQHKKNAIAWYEKNKERHKENAKERYKKNPDYHAEWRKNNPDRQIRHKYGLSQADYNKLLEDQNHVCAICGGVNKSGKALSVDHDHSCCAGTKSCGKCVRQLLCYGCNFMLGYAKDNPEILEAGKKYLERHSRPKNLAKIPAKKSASQKSRKKNEPSEYLGKKTNSTNIQIKKRTVQILR